MGISKDEYNESSFDDISDGIREILMKKTGRDRDDSIFRNLHNIINVYFKTYYKLGINLLQKIYFNYTNYIESQVVMTKLLLLLLEKINFQ